MPARATAVFSDSRKGATVRQKTSVYSSLENLKVDYKHHNNLHEWPGSKTFVFPNGVRHLAVHMKDYHRASIPFDRIKGSGKPIHDELLVQVLQQDPEYLFPTVGLPAWDQ